MKKSILQLICLVLSLVLLTGVLFSCAEQTPQEPDTTDTSDTSGENDNNDKNSKSPSKQLSNKELAFQLFEKADQAMEQVDSYTETAITSLDYTTDGVRMVGSNAASLTVTENNSDQFRYRVQTEGVATIYDGTTKLSEIEQISRNGFENGKMFYFSKYSEDGSDPQTTKLYSTISAADYQAFQKQMDADMDISAETCNNASCEQNADKSWTAVYSGFNQTMIRKMGIGEIAKLVGSDVQCDDMTITITFTEDYYPTMMSVEFSFSLVDPENTDVSLPTLSVTSNYKDINATQAPAAENMSGYTRVDDLRVSALLDKAMDDYLDSPSGKFEVSARTQTSVGSGAASEETMTHKGTFANANDKLSFTLTQTESDEISTYTYQDGVLQSTMNDSTRTTNTTDLAARVRLLETIHPVSFSTEEIKNIEVVSQTGTSTDYVIEFTKSEIVDSILESGWTLISSNYRLRLTLTDGVVTAYTYVLFADFSYMGQTIHFSMSIDVTFPNAN